VDQRDGELHALLVAVRELFDLAPGQAVEADPVDDPAGRVPGGDPVQAGEPGEVLDLFADHHRRVHASFLGHVPEPAPRARGDRRPAPSQRALVGVDETEQAAHQCGLAGPVRAQETGQPLGRGLERAPVQGADRSEGLADAVDLQHRGHPDSRSYRESTLSRRQADEAGRRSRVTGTTDPFPWRHPRLSAPVDSLHARPPPDHEYTMEALACQRAFSSFGSSTYSRVSRMARQT
jgi:hypothetical protein